MIHVTRLNSKEIVINADLIKFIESTPDTLITLSNGERIMVQEDINEVIRRVIEYQKTIRTFPS